MKKKIFILILLLSFSFISCEKKEEQNLDINVVGRVTNQNDVGIENVTIFIQRGKTGNYSATVFEQYQTITTNSYGIYNYLVKNDGYNYKVCCGIPSGYSMDGENCTNVNNSIINSNTILNTINFKLTE